MKSKQLFFGLLLGCLLISSIGLSFDLFSPPTSTTASNWVQAIAASFSALFAMAATYLVYDTVSETRKMTRLTQDMLEQQKEIGVIQNRAWLSIRSIEVDETTRGEEILLGVTVSIQNTGRTPATEVKISQRKIYSVRDGYESSTLTSDLLKGNHYSRPLPNPEIIAPDANIVIRQEMSRPPVSTEIILSLEISYNISGSSERQCHLEAFKSRRFTPKTPPNSSGLARRVADAYEMDRVEVPIDV